MTEIEYIQEQIDNNRECLHRLMAVVANHLPSTFAELSGVSKEWVRVAEEIEIEKENTHK